MAAPALGQLTGSPRAVNLRANDGGTGRIIEIGGETMRR